MDQQLASRDSKSTDERKRLSRLSRASRAQPRTTPVSQGLRTNVKASWCPEPAGSAEMIEPSVSCWGATGGHCGAEGSVVFLSPKLPFPRALVRLSRWSPALRACESQLLKGQLEKRDD